MLGCLEDGFGVEGAFRRPCLRPEAVPFPFRGSVGLAGSRIGWPGGQRRREPCPKGLDWEGCAPRSPPGLSLGVWPSSVWSWLGCALRPASYCCIFEGCGVGTGPPRCWGRISLGPADAGTPRGIFKAKVSLSPSRCVQWCFAGPSCGW